MRSPKIGHFTIVILLFVQLSYSCKKNGVVSSPVKPPSAAAINAVFPDSGMAGSIIVIKGSGFNTDPAKDTVTFNGLEAVVKNAGSDTLVVIVPQNAGSGPILVNGAVSPSIFTYIQAVFVTTLAGGGLPNTPGGYVLGNFANGIDSNARFSYPIGIAIDAHQNIYVTDEQNQCVRYLSGGMVSTFAGSRSPGLVNGPNALAAFNSPVGIAIDSSGNIYVADINNNVIRKISGGVVTSFAGSGQLGFLNGADTLAKFYYPAGLAFDKQNNLYVAEANDIREIIPSGVVSTLAGGSVIGVGGYMDGPDTSARFNNPVGVAVDAQGYVYVADNVNKRIRKISPAGMVTTLAGSGTQGLKDGPADSAQFFTLAGIALDRQDNIYVSDISCIRKITPAGTVSTLAGGFVRGFADGPGSVAQFYSPTGLAFDSQGNLYVADTQNQRIRKITY
jgi:sugar lactone lactonase YvrE